MPDPRDRLDLSGQPDQPEPAKSGEQPSPGGSYLRIFFSCSNTYARAQRTPAGDAYTARCPTCGLTKRFPIGPGGTSNRTFVLSCK